MCTSPRSLAASAALLLGAASAVVPPTIVHGQTASAIVAVSPAGDVVLSGSGRKQAATSAANPWVFGTQIGGQLYGDGGISDDLLLSGKVVRPIVTTAPVHLYTFGNVGSLTEEFAAQNDEERNEALVNLTQGARGVAVGAQALTVLPYSTWLRAVPFATGRLRVSRAKATSPTTAPPPSEGEPGEVPAAEETDRTETLLQRQLGLGLELHFGKLDEAAHKPLTLSISRHRTWTDSAVAARVLGPPGVPRYVTEYTAILPLTDRLGVVAEVTQSTGVPRAWRLAVLVLTGGDTDEDDTESVQQSDVDRDSLAGADTTPATDIRTPSEAGARTAVPLAANRTTRTYSSAQGSAPPALGTIVIASSGAGDGTITATWGAGARQVCRFRGSDAATCTIVAPRGDTVVLMAEEATGHRINAWHHDGCGTGSRACVVPVMGVQVIVRAPFVR